MVTFPNKELDIASFPSPLLLLNKILSHTQGDLILISSLTSILRLLDTISYLASYDHQLSSRGFLWPLCLSPCISWQIHELYMFATMSRHNFLRGPTDAGRKEGDPQKPTWDPGLPFDPANPGRYTNSVISLHCHVTAAHTDTEEKILRHICHHR